MNVGPTSVIDPGGMILGAGGARQFIHQSFPVAASRQEELCHLLNSMVPPLDSETYTVHYPIPACFPGSLLRKPSAFYFDSGSVLH